MSGERTGGAGRDGFGMAAARAGWVLPASLVLLAVMLAFGIWRGPRDYLVRFEPFADAGPSCRGARDAAAAESAARYAARLEEVCRAHPHNWFNFHDFWDEAK